MVRKKNKKYAALALLEFDTVASGILASDLMVKRSPIALLRCGTVHPGRFLILVGGSVASTEEAYQVGVRLGNIEHTMTGSVFLGDVHPMLHDAVLGTRLALDGEALAVVETRSSPALLAAVDAAVKSTPVTLAEVRLADDLGGHAIALMSGDLTDADTALAICSERAGDQLLARSILPRLDINLRQVLDEGTSFEFCENFEPAGAEHPEEVACSWEG
jgi:microcompartment protein CcmL/EutN